MANRLGPFGARPIERNSAQRARSENRGARGFGAAGGPIERNSAQR